MYREAPYNQFLSLLYPYLSGCGNNGCVLEDWNYKVPASQHYNGYCHHLWHTRQALHRDTADDV